MRAAGYIALLAALAWQPLARADGPPQELRQLASATAVGGVVYFRPGDLLLGAPQQPGRPAVRPMEGEQRVVLPADLSGYDDLSSCCSASQGMDGDDPSPDDAPAAGGSTAEGRTVLAHGDLGGDGLLERVEVLRVSPQADSQVQVFRGERLVGSAALPMPVQLCKGLVAEADDGDAPLLLLVWTSSGAGGVTVGVTVFDLVEAAP